MNNSTRHRALARFVSSGTMKTVAHIGLDVVVTLGLLAALSVVHHALEYTAATEEFKLWFARVHEWYSSGCMGRLRLRVWFE
jgi:hypothetical protein